MKFFTSKKKQPEQSEEERLREIDETNKKLGLPTRDERIREMEMTLRTNNASLSVKRTINAIDGDHSKKVRKPLKFGEDRKFIEVVATESETFDLLCEHPCPTLIAMGTSHKTLINCVLGSYQCQEHLAEIINHINQLDDNVFDDCTKEDSGENKQKYFVLMVLF